MYSLILMALYLGITFLKYMYSSCCISLLSIMDKGEENCQDLIEAHKKCLRDAGFNI